MRNRVASSSTDRFMWMTPYLPNHVRCRIWVILRKEGGRLWEIPITSVEI